jgi:hypothetical protein
VNPVQTAASFDEAFRILNTAGFATVNVNAIWDKLYRVRMYLQTVAAAALAPTLSDEVAPHKCYGDMRTYADGKRHCEFPQCGKAL